MPITDLEKNSRNRQFSKRGGGAERDEVKETGRSQMPKGFVSPF